MHKQLLIKLFTFLLLSYSVFPKIATNFCSAKFEICTPINIFFVGILLLLTAITVQKQDAR